MIERIKDTIKFLKELDRDTLEGIRMTLFFFIVIDLGFFYWFMKWKRIALALMLVCLIILVVVLLLERRFPPEKENEYKGKDLGHIITKEVKMKKQKKIKEPKEIDKEDEYKETEEVEKSNILGFDTGLPSAEDYNKRLSESLGSL